MRIALRTQQIIAHETGVANTIDPLGGAYFVEALTDELERQAYDYFAKIDELGGMVAAVKQNYPQREIADASFELQHEIDAGRRIVVGVNEYRQSDERPLELHRVDPAMEAKQVARVQAVRARRDGAAVEATLSALKQTAAREDANLMPGLLDAARAHVDRGRDHRGAAGGLRLLHGDAGLLGAPLFAPLRPSSRAWTADPRSESKFSRRVRSLRCGRHADHQRPVAAERETVEAVLADPTLIRPVFQPIVDLRRSAVQGYEMLARLANDPSGTPAALARRRRAPRDGQRPRGQPRRGRHHRPRAPAARHLPLHQRLAGRPGQQRGPRRPRRRARRPGPARLRAHRAERGRGLRRPRHRARPRPRRRRPRRRRGRRRRLRQPPARPAPAPRVRQARSRPHQRRPRRSGQARDHRGRRPLLRAAGRRARGPGHRAPRRAGDARRARRPARPGLSSSAAPARRSSATCRSPACAP